MKIILANQFKNESLRIEEWLRYHKELGFNDFVLMDDHSNDNSIEIAKSINGINVEVLSRIDAELSFKGAVDTDLYRGNSNFAEMISRSFMIIHEHVYKKYGNNSIIGFFDIDEFIFSEEELDVIKTIVNEIKDLPVLSLWGFEVNSDKFQVNGKWITLQTTNSMSMNNKLKSTKSTNIKSFQNLMFKHKTNFFNDCLTFKNYGGIIHNGGINDQNYPPDCSKLAFLHYRKPIYDPIVNLPLCDKDYNIVEKIANKALKEKDGN